MHIADANVVLRYLLFDNAELAAQAADIIEKTEIFIPFEVVAEIVYVLEKVYKIRRKEISNSILELFQYENIGTNDDSILLKAMGIFSSSKMDFVDTLLCGYSEVRGDDVITFDKEINRFLEKIRRG